MRTYSRTQKEEKMYTKEQQERALKEFKLLGSVQAIINFLGYPTRNTLYKWNKAVRANKQNHHGSLDKPYEIKNRNINSPSHPRNHDINAKFRCNLPLFFSWRRCRIYQRK